MARPARLALIAAALTVVVGIAIGVRAADKEPGDSRAAHDQWIAKYAEKSLDGNLLSIRLIDEGRTERSLTTSTVTVTPDGKISWESTSDFGTKGGSGNSVSPESLKRLAELAANLPPDAESLPPPERRVLIQTSKATRVYDRAELADPVAELLRISQAGIGSWHPDFQPQRQIDMRGGGLLTLLPDGKRLLCGTQLLALPTFESLGDMAFEGYREIAIGPNHIVVAPSNLDCQIIDDSTWKVVGRLSEPHEGRIWPQLSDPHLTPDGRCLVMSVSGDRGLRFFDTKTWQRVDPMPEIPADAVQWKPSKTWQRAIIRSKAGAISLWDVKSKSARELDPAAPLLDAAFSPDESQVVVETADKNGYSNPRLRIFQTKTGTLVHELRVNEIGCDRLRRPSWTADGHYVLAITKPNSFWSNENVSLWSAKTGRHRADFVGSVGMDDYLLLPPGDQLIASGDRGQLHVWDFAGAIRQIKAFEESLPGAPAAQP